MIVLDASAVTAIVAGAPQAERLLNALAHDGKGHMSMVTLAECVAAIGPDMNDALDRWLTFNHVAVINLERSIALAAADAFRRYRNAGLTLDDCIPYALAKRLDAALLTANPAFANTDVELG